MTTHTVLGTLLRLGDDFGGSSGGQYLGLFDEVRSWHGRQFGELHRYRLRALEQHDDGDGGNAGRQRGQAYTMSLLRIPCQLRTMLLSVLVLNTLVRLTRSR